MNLDFSKLEKTQKSETTGIIIIIISVGIIAFLVGVSYFSSPKNNVVSEKETTTVTKDNKITSEKLNEITAKLRQVNEQIKTQSLMGIPYDATKDQSGLRGAICEQCNRIFTLDYIVMQAFETASCPYCGREQRTGLALHRYAYYLQQQTQQQAQQQLQQAQALQQAQQQALALQQAQQQAQQEAEYRQLLQIWANYQSSRDQATIDANNQRLEYLKTNPFFSGNQRPNTIQPFQKNNYNTKTECYKDQFGNLRCNSNGAYTY
jgi:hypothetical protein